MSFTNKSFFKSNYGFDNSAVAVLKERYMHVNPDTGEQETIPEIFMRVANYVAKDEQHAEQYFKAMINHDFLPNSPTLMNAGREGEAAQLSACFVLPIEDSMDGIFTALRNQALIHKYGGGTGFNFSTLRPKGSRVNTTNGLASGPVSFMELFDMATEKVMQGGTRRGANMGILNVDHPDILEFIKCKSENKNTLNNFNISVGMNDNFMQKAADKCLDERESKIWKAIIDCAWRNGDPGLVFFDEINRRNTTPELGELTATNPCLRGNMKILTDKGYFAIEELVGKKVNIWNGYAWSEVEPRITGHNQPMLRISFSNGSVIDCTPYHKFILNGGCKIEAKDLKPDDELALYTIATLMSGYIIPIRYSGVCVVSVEPCENADIVYCLTEPKNHSMIVEGVLTGNCGESPLLPFESCNLGSINLSNFVTETGGEYFKGRGVDFERLEKVTRIAVDFLNDVIDVNHYPLPEITEAVHLTRKIGLGIMGWADMLYKLGIRYGSKQSLELAEKVMSFINNVGHEASNGRNATVTCIAPTGSISLIAGCSSGIEPLFALEYDRIAFAKDGENSKKILHFINPEYKQALKDNDERVQNGVFVTAHDLNFFEHIDMQAVFQKYTDLAVSKTINLKNEATKADVERAYIYAWLSGCKGITIYRDGSRDTQVLIAGEECPECGSKSVIYESGCKKCMQCGWSPCSA